MKATVIATVICLIAAILEAVLAGGRVRFRLSELRMPAYSPGFLVWMSIGLLYYVMCFLILRRLLFGGTFSNSHPWALMLVIAVLAANASWNVLFFRLRALFASFLAFIPYGILVLALAAILIPIYAFGTMLLTAYCGYLIYAAWWSYRVWQLNDRKHSIAGIPRAPDLPSD